MPKRPLPERELEEPPSKKHDSGLPGLPQDAGSPTGPDVDPYVGSDDDSDAGSDVDSDAEPFDPEAPAPTSSKRHACSWAGCDMTFNRPSRLQAHIRIHMGLRPHKCPHENCDKDYAEQRHLNDHIKTAHLNQRDHICDYPGCGKSFSTRTKRNRHAASHEDRDNRPRCTGYPPCKLVFRQKTALERHIRADHKGLPPYACRSCDEAFNSSGALRNHVNKVHAEPTFWCETCPVDEATGEGVGFTQLSQLKAHMRNEHMSCVFCDMKCASKAELAKHVELAHGDAEQKPKQPFLCPVENCPKQFARKSGLNAHIKSAHEKRKFVCGEVDVSKSRGLGGWDNKDGCGASLTSKAGLEAHIKHIHMMLPRPDNKYRQNEQDESAEGGQRLDDVSGSTAKPYLWCSARGCKFYCIRYHELEKHMEHLHPEVSPDGQPGQVNGSVQQPQPQTEVQQTTEYQPPEVQTPAQQLFAQLQQAPGQGPAASWISDESTTQAEGLILWDEQTDEHQLSELQAHVQQTSSQPQQVPGPNTSWAPDDESVSHPSSQAENLAIWNQQAHDYQPMQGPRPTVPWTPNGQPVGHPSSQEGAFAVWDQQTLHKETSGSYPAHNRQLNFINEVDNPVMHANNNATHPLTVQYHAEAAPHNAVHTPTGIHAPTGHAMDFQPLNEEIGFGTNQGNMTPGMMQGASVATQSSSNHTNLDGNNGTHLYDNQVHHANGASMNNPPSMSVGPPCAGPQNKHISQETGQGSAGFPAMEAAGQMVGVHA